MFWLKLCEKKTSLEFTGVVLGFCDGKKAGLGVRQPEPSVGSDLLLSSSLPLAMQPGATALTALTSRDAHLLRDARAPNPSVAITVSSTCKAEFKQLKNNQTDRDSKTDMVREVRERPPSPKAGHTWCHTEVVPNTQLHIEKKGK